MRKPAALVSAALLALPPGSIGAAPSQGTIQGLATIEGRPLAGVGLAFVDAESGTVVRTSTGRDGSFLAKAAPGAYLVTTESRAGLVLGQAPPLVPVVAGRVASLNLDVRALPFAALQEPPPVAPAEHSPSTPPARESLTTVTGAPASGPVATTGSGARIDFVPVTCFVAGEYPLLDSKINPVPSVARARVFFKGAQSVNYFFVEMTHEEGTFYGKLPRPRVEASPITYYLQSTTTEFEESQTAEIEAIVVEKKEDCEDRPVAAFGPPGDVTVFSALTGTAINPVGFAAGGAAIAGGTLLAVLIGAGAAGITGGIIVQPQPTPIPTPTPEPTSVPTPIPTPIPTATPITPSGP